MNSKNNLAFAVIAIILSMVILTFASVPIYNLFCKVTGFGGTTQISQKLSKTKGTQKILVNFDANVAPDLSWKFIPKQHHIEIVPGENVLVFYYAENLTDQKIVGTAVYNVSPPKAGKYFNKVHCFCFEEQLLQPGQKVMMPVSFFIDTDIEKDIDTKDIDNITLSYSFYKVR